MGRKEKKVRVGMKVDKKKRVMVVDEGDRKDYQNIRDGDGRKHY